MDMPSHPDSERVGDGELSRSYDEAFTLPPSHTEGLAYAEDPTLANAAFDIYANEVLFGAGLRKEWDNIVGPDPPEGVFWKAYQAYVTDPTVLYREAPDQYHFLKDHVFFGLEYRRALTFGDQVGEGIEALRQIEALRPEVYEGLSIREREAVLQEVENCLAECQGRPAVPVELEQMKPTYLGVFRPQTGAMYLNRDLVADGSKLAEVVDTVAHEGRHAYQHFAITHPGFHPDANAVSAWSHNFEHYLEPRLNPMRYREQPVEADAFAFGDAVRDGLFPGGRP